MLLLGDLAALVGTAEWTLAGTLYPLLLWFNVPDLPLWVFRYFLSSLLICGLIAAAYPFFVVNYITTRVFYPAVLPYGPIDEDERRTLSKLSSRSSIYLLVAAGVPLLALLVTVLSSLGEATAIVLIFAGLIGLALAFFLYQRLQSHWSAIQRLADVD